MSLISEIQITPLHSKDGELVAFANFTVAGAIRCKSVGILRRLHGGYRLAYPTKRLTDRQFNYFFPISRAIGQEIEDMVIAEYQRVIGGAKWSTPSF